MTAGAGERGFPWLRLQLVASQVAGKFAPAPPGYFWEMARESALAHASVWCLLSILVPPAARDRGAGERV